MGTYLLVSARSRGNNLSIGRMSCGTDTDIWSSLKDVIFLASFIFKSLPRDDTMLGAGICSCDHNHPHMGRMHMVFLPTIFHTSPSYISPISLPPHT